MLSIQIDTKSLELVNNIKLSFFASHMKSSFLLCTFQKLYGYQIQYKYFKSYSKDCEKTGSFFDIQYCQFGFLMGFFQQFAKRIKTMRGLEIKCWESTVQQRERFRKSSRTKLGVKLVLHTVSSATSRVVVLSLSRTPLLAFFFSFSSIHILGYFLISKCQRIRCQC